MIQGIFFKFTRAGFRILVSVANVQPMFKGLIMLMEEVLHQLIGSLSHSFQGFIYTRWCRISEPSTVFLPYNHIIPVGSMGLVWTKKFFGSHRRCFDLIPKPGISSFQPLKKSTTVFAVKHFGGCKVAF